MELAMEHARRPPAKGLWRSRLREISIDLLLGAPAAIVTLLVKLQWPGIFGADPNALFLMPAAVCAWRRGFRSGSVALLCGGFVFTQAFLVRGGFSRANLLALMVFLLEGGSIVALVAFSRRRVDTIERNASRSQQEFALLLAGVSDCGFLLLDSSATISSWNSGASRLTLSTREAMIGRPATALCTEESTASMTRALEQAAHRGSDHRDICIRRSDGTMFYADVTVVALRDDEENLRGYSAVIRDITAARDAQQALAESEEKYRLAATNMPDVAWMTDATARTATSAITSKRSPVTRAASCTRARTELEEAQRLSELGRVASNIAHEVNNVLMAIYPQAELIDRAAPGVSSVRTAANRIRSAVLRGRRITEEILRFTHPREPEVLDIDTRQWLKGVIDQVRTLVHPGIDVVLDLPPEPIMIQGDQAQLQQVVINICSNANNAMAEEGLMTIRLAKTSSRFAEVTIADTGVGIASDILPHIFEPLFSGMPGKGSGLGLAVARQIVTQHGGTLDVTSKPGHGSTFTVRLPDFDPSPRSIVWPSVPDKPAGACRRLLLVEDDDDVSFGIASLMELEGIEVRVAREGGGVGQAIRDFSPQVVVLDVTLPDLSGTVLFERIRKEWPELPIVISTGQMCDPSIFVLERQPHTEFLMKPYASDELLSRIQRIVAG